MGSTGDAADFIDLRVRYRTGRTDSGTCFVDNRTGRVNLFNFNEGSAGTGSGPGTVRFRCESFDRRYRECQIPIEGDVKRLPRLSDASCDENRSWGRRGDRTWVDHGCRSDFEVTSHGWGGGSDGNSGQQQRAEAACRNEAKRQFMTLTRILPASFQGSYWRSMLYCSVRGQPARDARMLRPVAATWVRRAADVESAGRFGRIPHRDDAVARPGLLRRELQLSQQQWPRRYRPGAAAAPLIVSDWRRSCRFAGVAAP